MDAPILCPVFLFPGVSTLALSCASCQRRQATKSITHKKRMNPMLIRNTLFSAVLVAAAMATGCASINKAPSAMNTEAKQFNTHPDYAQVYVYRNETFGAALSMPVSVDGRQAGTTGPKSFFRFQLEPGQHTISSQNGASSLLLNTEANRNYFVWQEVKMGLVSGGSKLQVVSEQQGRAGVQQCTMIKSNL
ncbi:DUF2846 domain-containing protein [Pseudomonas sp.]|uniref:DUF2846 domain-containing protein n=1 Tax=Pseudomonas sp. TaxID=306 RepID=UPI000C904B2B|nr:hypothetical protein [Pseudomonadales bacterium]|tara:strand:- start:349 stop:921 length:573 start_codon:yes stop_codon:yes gene_type:complete